MEVSSALGPEPRVSMSKLAQSKRDDECGEEWKGRSAISVQGSSENAQPLRIGASG